KVPGGSSVAWCARRSYEQVVGSIPTGGSQVSMVATGKVLASWSYIWSQPGLRWLHDRRRQACTAYPWRGRNVAQPVGACLRVRRYRSGDQQAALSHRGRPGRGEGFAGSRDATHPVPGPFLSQVDEQRNPRTRATVNQLLDRYFELLALRVTAHNRRA